MTEAQPPRQPRSRTRLHLLLATVLALAVGAAVALTLTGNGDPAGDSPRSTSPAAFNPDGDNQFIIDFIRANNDASWRDEINSVELVAYTRLQIETDLTRVEAALEVCERGRLFLRDLNQHLYGSAGSDDVQVFGMEGIGRLAEASGGPCRPS